MKKMSKEAQRQTNGGYSALHPWKGACTTCNYMFSALTQAGLQKLGLAHHNTYYTKTAPHRWVYIQKGY